MRQTIRGPVLACTLLTGLAAGACASAGSADVAAETEVASSAAECTAFAESPAPVVFYGMDSTMPSWEPASRISAAPGASLPINVGRYYGPGGIRPVPLECIDWQIEPAGHASVSEDGERLTVASDLLPGSVVELTAVVAREGERARSGTLRVSIIDEASSQLLGTWDFEETRGCDAMTLDPPRELRFEPESGMSVAWTVLETYWDYWGRYTWSPESGDFRFETTGGNRIPPDVSEGGRLVLEDARRIAITDFHFGARDPDALAPPVSAADAGCALVFRRQR